MCDGPNDVIEFSRRYDIPSDPRQGLEKREEWISESQGDYHDTKVSLVRGEATEM